MKKLFKKISLRRLCYALLSFILALTIVAGSVSMIIRLTFLNKGFLSDTLNSSNYYSDLCVEITDNLTDLGDASGLDRSFFESFVDEVLVRKNVQSYIDNFYAGKELVVSTAGFEEELRSALNKYIENKKIKNVNEKNIDYFVAKACKIYEKSVKITYFSSIQKLVSKLNTLTTVIAIISVLISAGIVCLLLFTNEWKHKSVRYLYTSVSASGLFLLSFPLGVYLSGTLGRLSILSRSLSDMYLSVLRGALNDLIVFSAVLLVVGISLWVVHNHLRRKAAI